MRQVIETTVEGLDESDAQAAVADLLAAFAEPPFMSPSASVDSAGLHLRVEYDDREGVSQNWIAMIFQDRITGVLRGESDTPLANLYDNLKDLHDHEVERRRSMPQFTDPVVGAFYWEESIGWWETLHNIGPSNASFVISVEDQQADVSAQLKRAREVFENLPLADERLRKEYATREKDSYNHEWNDGPDKSAEEIASQLRLSIISFAPDKSYVATYDTGELYSIGWTVDIRVDPNDVIEE